MLTLSPLEKLIREGKAVSISPALEQRIQEISRRIAQYFAERSRQVAQHVESCRRVVLD